MTQLVRATAILLGTVLVAAACAILLVPPSALAGTPANVTVAYTQATATHSAAVNPATVTVAAGGSVTFDNTKGTANLTISGTLAGAKPIAIAKNAKGSIAVAPSTASKMLTYTATESATVPVSVAKTAASGQVNVTGVAPTNSSAGPSGGTAVGGQPSGGSAGSQPSGDTPGSGYVGPGLPGGVIAPLAPGATAYPNGPAPLVAPFATATASAAPSSPGESSGTAPTSVAALSPPGGGSGTRSLGLPAAVTAVVLIGVVAALVRVLLTHPAARAVPRRH